MSINQTKQFKDESFRYTQSYLNQPSNLGVLKLIKAFPQMHPEKILDVGCGNGANLDELCQLFSCAGVGIELSDKAVGLLKEKYSDSSYLHFVQGSAHHLPIETDDFDLTIIWSVLHWVGRNEYLQAIGELIRTTRQYLIIMDFCPLQDYRTPYTHKEGLYTYKQDFAPIVEASGIMRKIEEISWWEPQPGNYERLGKKELTPLTNNPLNYHARKLVVFEKDYDLLQKLDAADFLSE